MNTFVVIDCKKRKNVLTTHSARKAKGGFYIGAKIEVWHDGQCVEVIYSRSIEKINKYVSMQKQHIAEMQMKKTKQRSNRRK